MIHALQNLDIQNSSTSPYQLHPDGFTQNPSCPQYRKRKVVKSSRKNAIAEPYDVSLSHTSDANSLKVPWINSTTPLPFATTNLRTLLDFVRASSDAIDLYYFFSDSQAYAACPPPLINHIWTRVRTSARRGTRAGIRALVAPLRNHAHACGGALIHAVLQR